MGKILSVILGIIFIAAGAFLVYGNFEVDSTTDEVANQEEEQETEQIVVFDPPKTFSAQVEGEIETNSTTPGAAKTPDFLLQLYPNLTVRDFANVEADGGSYAVVDNEIVFIPSSKNNEKNPSARIISEEGMETLLINVISRTGMVVDSQKTLTELFVFLKDHYEFSLSTNVEVTSPSMNELVTSPLTITGKAKDFYLKDMFDAALFDDQNNLMATSTAKSTAKVQEGEFVPFTSTITFGPTNATSGKIVLSPRVSATSAPPPSFEMVVRFR